jgi:hypothetical protein
VKASADVEGVVPSEVLDDDGVEDSVAAAATAGPVVDVLDVVHGVVVDVVVEFGVVEVVVVVVVVVEPGSVLVVLVVLDVVVSAAFPTTPDVSGFTACDRSGESASAADADDSTVTNRRIPEVAFTSGRIRLSLPPLGPRPVATVSAFCRRPGLTRSHLASTDFVVSLAASMLPYQGERRPTAR